MADTPNPGSQEAINKGCTCAVSDNGYGKGYMCQPGIYWINADCPLHGMPEPQPKTEERLKKQGGA